MKTEQINNGAIIWCVCAVYIMLITIVYPNILINDELKPVTKFWLLFAVVFIPYLFEKTYWFFARYRKYSLNLVRGITNCRTISWIIGQSFVIVFFFTALIVFASNANKEIPKGLLFVAIIVLACLVSIKPIIPFVKKEYFAGKRRQKPSSLLDAFIPRFIILYTFVVYYIITYVKNSSSNDIIPSLCVVYIGVERLINMFQTISEYSKQGYFSMFRDTVKWVREQRKGLN